MKNKILLFIGIFITLFSNGICNVNALSNSLKIDETLNRIFKIEKIHSVISDYYNIKDYNSNQYPLYFGGMYVSDDSKNVILQIVKDNIPDENSDEYSIYKKIINLDSSIKIQYVENSYNELNDINKRMADYMVTEEGKNINTSYIDIINNTVVVDLYDDCSEQQQKIKSEFLKFKINVDTKLIKFNKSNGNTLKSININAGQPIEGICSMGFRVKYNGKNGYLTAGHCTTNVGQKLTTGIVRVRQFATLENYDYAFVETSSTFNPTNNLNITNPGMTKLAVINNSCPFIYQGLEIGKIGGKTGYTTGKITGINVNVIYEEGYAIHNLVKSDLYSVKGDSGGVIFIPRSDSVGGAIPIGILSGGNTKNEPNNATTYFTNFSDLPPSLQIRY